MDIINFYKKHKLTFKVTVKGECMSPLIKNGDVITIQPSDFYNIDDIVLCKDNNGVIYIHRIIEIKNNYYYTKADNNFCIDISPVSIENIFGRAVI